MPAWQFIVRTRRSIPGRFTAAESELERYLRKADELRLTRLRVPTQHTSVHYTWGA